MEIVSVFRVVDYKTGKEYMEYIIGYGQKAISILKKEYPFFTKFVLEGFEVNGNFIPLKISKTRYI
jgi:hypothetical protein